MLRTPRNNLVGLIVVLLLVVSSLGASLLDVENDDHDYEIEAQIERGLSGSEESSIHTMDWYDPDWSYRREVTVSTDDPIQSDYQVVVTLTTSVMGDPYEGVDPDGEDLRFTDTDGVSELSYWIQSWDNTGESTIWVRLSDPVDGSSSKTIYLYYGNPDASPATDPDTTFQVYDDFSDGDVDGWTNEGGGQPYHDNGRLAWYSDGYPQVCYYTGAQMNREQRVEAMIDPASEYVGQGFLIQDQSNNYISRAIGDYRMMKIQGGGYEVLAAGANTGASNYRYDVWFDDDIIHASIAENTVSASDGTWTSGHVGLSSWWANSGTHYMDWIRVREYTANEPTTWVSEQVEPTLEVEVPDPLTGDVMVSWNGQQETVTDQDTFVTPYGTDVELEALAADIHEFGHWDGDHSGTDKQTTVIMDENKEVSAHFDTVPIEDWYDLDSLRDFLATDAYFYLGAHLDEGSDGYDELVDSENGWDPIGDDSTPFMGTLDGDGYSIQDLYINRSNEEHVGVFGYVGDSGMIKNLGLIHNDVSGDGDVGALVGSNYGTVSNSYATGEVSGEGWRVGGLIGMNEGTVSNSYATGNVSASGGRVGGLIGMNEYGGTVENSYATGSVIETSEESDDHWAIGGLVGMNEGAVNNCHATGDVTGDIRAGGLVGINYEGGEMLRSYATGDVVGQSRVGGLAGENRGGYVAECVSYAEVEGSSQVGGLIGFSVSESTEEVFEAVSTGSEGEIQTWTVPFTGDYTITVRGAQGGDSWDHDGGTGAVIRAEIRLNEGDVLSIAVGQRGDSGISPGGSGGSFVVRDDVPLVIAGGGAGAGMHDHANKRATTSTFGNDAYHADSVGAGYGGSDGQGGGYGSTGTGWDWNRGAGGGGFETKGGEYDDSDNYAEGGYPWSDLSGGNNGYAGQGGYGGGGESGYHDEQSGYGGGGGGYSGGGGGVWDGDLAQEGGGGGSFIHVDAISAATSDGDWEYTGNEPHEVYTGSVDDLDDWNEGYGQVTVEAQEYSEMRDSYARGDVTGESLVGGLIGEIHSSFVFNSYSAGIVDGSEDDTTGGLIGRNEGSEIEDSFWDVDSSSVSESDGGTGKTSDEMKDVSTFTDLSTEGLDEPWDFVGNPNDDEGDQDTWDIDEFEVMNSGYPYLSWQEFLGVAVEAPSDITENSSGIYDYHFVVNNTGNTDDTYDLEAETSDPDWTVDVTGQVDVGGGDEETVEVSVTIPDDAGGDSSDITLTAESQKDPTVGHSDSMNVALEERLDVLVQAPEDRSEGSSGTYTYSYQVENNGNTEETYDLDADADQTNWIAESSIVEITLDVGSKETIDVEVTIPEDVGGETSTVTLTAESQSDSAVTDSDSMQVTLEEDIGVMVHAPQDQTESDTGTHTYIYEVENTGNAEDIYELSASAEKTDWSASSPSTVTVSPGETEEVNVEVEIPSDVEDLESSDITLTASSQKDTDVSHSDSMIVSYDQAEVREVVVIAQSDVTEDGPGTYTYDFEVHNTGNVEDTYDISVYETGWDIDAPEEISVGQGDIETVNVDVTIPEGAEDGDSIEVTLTAESQEDSDVSDTDSMVIGLNVEISEYQLTIEAGEGGTTEPEPGDYTHQEGAEVVVEAIPDEGMYFTEWTGDHESKEKKITVTMDGDKELMANFGPIGEDERLLTIQREGEGTTDPEPGSYVHEEGEEVKIGAIPADGWSFSHWSGDIDDAQKEDAEITVVLEEDIDVTAHFEEVEIWVEILTPREGDVFGETAVELEWDSHNVYSHEVRLTGGEWIDVDEATTYEFEDLDHGHHTIEVRATGWGVSVHDIINITVDTVPPELEILSPGQGEKVTQPNVVVEWEGSDDMSGIHYFELRIDDGQWIYLENETDYRLEDLEDREYDVTVRAVDRVGNQAEKEISFTVESEEEPTSIFTDISNTCWILLLIPLIIIPVLLLWFTKGKDEQDEARGGETFADAISKMERSDSQDAQRETTGSKWVSVRPVTEKRSDHGVVEGATHKRQHGQSHKVVDKRRKLNELSRGDMEEKRGPSVIDEERKTDDHEEEKEECPGCGFAVDDDEYICPQCGHIIGDKEELFTLEDEIFFECKECGFLITEEEEECPYCDTTLDDGKGDGFFETGENKDVLASSDPKLLSGKTCTMCGEDLSEDQEICHKCGHIFDEEEE